MKRLQLVVSVFLFLGSFVMMASGQAAKTKTLKKIPAASTPKTTPVPIGSACSLQFPEVSLIVDPSYNKIMWESTGGTYLIAFHPWYKTPCHTSSGRPIYLFETSANKPSAYCYAAQKPNLGTFKYDIVEVGASDSETKLCADPAVIVSDGNRIQRLELGGTPAVSAALSNDVTNEISSHCALVLPSVVLSKSPQGKMQWTPISGGPFTITFEDSSKLPCLDKSNGNPQRTFNAPPGANPDTCFVNTAADDDSYKYTVTADHCAYPVDGTLEIKEHGAAERVKGPKAGSQKKN